MRRRAAALALCLAGLLLLAASSGAQRSQVPSIELSGTIDPATERWLESALSDAAEDRAPLAIVRLDTPGGLAESMREMVKHITNAPLPVVVYVSPRGARAASAGLFVTLAADVAAMAPQTNIGAATPVSLSPGGAEDLSDTLDRKITNDTAALARALAVEHGRNGELAEEMVRKATSVTGAEAERRELIDLVSGSEEDLLTQLDGFRVRGPKEARLETGSAVLDRRDMPLSYEILQLIVNPTIAYLLLLVGIAGIAIEVLSGFGVVAPGTFGLVSLLLGLYGTALLPFTAVGILLLLLGIGMIVAEAHLPTGGALGGAGVAALIGSGLLLYDTDSEAFEVNALVVIFTGLLIGGFVAFAVQRTIAVHRNRARTGWEELVGVEGEVRTPLDPVGQVFVEGALWRARPSHEGAEISTGRIRVDRVEGLTLYVSPVD